MRVSGQAVVVSCSLAVAAALAATAFVQWRDRTIELGFWFGDVSYDASEAMTAELGGPLTAAEIAEVERVARTEVERAYDRLRVVVSQNRSAPYKVVVVQDFTDGSSRYPYPAAVGQSHSIPGIGGTGMVNFRLLVSNATVLAPPGTSRSAIVRGIGNGVGRTAVHEFAHQLLGSRAVDDPKDARSYEFDSSHRVDQYYGELHWGIAWTALEKRIGLKPSGSLPVRDARASRPAS